MPNFFKNTILIIVFFITISAFAQEGKELNIQSDVEQIDEAKYPGAIVMYKSTKQVYIQHEGIEMWCDLAFNYKDENFVRAIGNVRMNQGDTITMRSNYAEYNGNTQFAWASGGVNLRTPTATLDTDTLYFDRIKQQAYYRNSGTLRDTASVINSKIGRYFLDQDKYSFVQNVVVTNPEYVINSDQLDFYSESGIAYLYGPSTITSDASVVYCERGYYDTRNDNGYFVKNSRIDYDNRTVYGDSLYFDRPTNFASATNNIRVIDTANKSIIKGHYAEVYKAKDSVFITKRAVAITVQDQDSVYVHGDRLVVTGIPEKRIVRGYYNVRLFKSDLSGKSDSIHINQQSGLTQMIGKPILWSGLSQMTGDTIHLKSNTVTEKLDSLRVFKNAFLAKQDMIPLSDTPSKRGYNQVKGDDLYGTFLDNKLHQLDIIKNAESINYMRSDDGILQGIDKSKSASITAILENNELVEITKWRQVDGDVFPLSKFEKEAREFPGLNWRGDERLLTKEDIFKGEAPFTLTKIEGIPLPEIEEDFFDNTIPDNKLGIPSASQLDPSDFKNRDEDSPSIGLPVNDKATIKQDSLAPKNPANILKEQPPVKAKDSTQTEN
ncbi:OstA-like protein [Leeuwenhoekiella sp. MAR_2009_132]|uniref:OstA-like protein n=1 Tax=Leeuwenhoekiella sp. MAR_2009_132 TaxID=1392489 RepID=UPI00048AFC9D|nr:OstA-like protein [Leeuwenhoekiella sp. MAR_2009_132]